MITIKFLIHNENICGFTVKGHALFADYGEDIVCASVSTLTIGTINSIMRICKEEVEIEKDDGLIGIHLSSTLESSIEAQTLMKSMLYNLQDIEEQYPKNVCVKKNF
ncbi:ribosomal-processing cysteine protease Prp [Rossellomorea sp. LJF3]|uniref:ribosomal-processing cysteine protease Prp n=1 Tax=Rossellomorea sp. LJF3 TaxID=3126099 RepID=UPI00300C0585